MAEPARPDVRYTAFLSYSHMDAAAAGRLHRRLEAYRMPRRLAGSEGSRGPVPDRLAPIFRDREELPAATDLSETVREALAQSGALIILCSPHAAGSLWVAEEIGTFRTLHPDRPILAAILDGDPPDCFPAALRAFGRDGTWHEPLATDLRPGKDGRQLGLLKLVAGVTGVGLDALVQRDAARRVRRITTLSTMALIALVVMAALALVAFNARREAERQRAEAEGIVEFMHTDLRERLKGVGRLEIMSSVNRRALAYYDRQIARGYGRVNLPMRARILLAIGDDDLRRGDDARALAHFREAHGATSALLARSPNDPEILFAHGQSEYWMGYFDYRRERTAAARRSWDRYKAISDRLLAREPDNPARIRESGYAEGNLCTVALLQQPQDAALARRTCSIALQRVERVVSLLGDDPDLIADLANRHAWMAGAWDLNNRWDLALRHHLRREALARSLIEAHPTNLEYRDRWMGGQFGFGQMLASHGRHRDARSRFADAAAAAATLRASDPENVDWRRLQGRIQRAMQNGGRNAD